MRGGCPFRADEVAVIKGGRIARQTWIDIWQMLVYTNYRAAFPYALYVGYDRTFLEFVDVIKYRDYI